MRLLLDTMIHFDIELSNVPNSAYLRGDRYNEEAMLAMVQYCKAGCSWTHAQGPPALYGQATCSSPHLQQHAKYNTHQLSSAAVPTPTYAKYMCSCALL